MSDTPKAMPADTSALPAHALYVELATRITTQRLHYRSGDEETAARSLHSLFGLTRELMAEHPAATAFHGAALVLLNKILRSYTARWHGWMTQDGDKVDGKGNPVLKLRDECFRRKFREELRELQPLLLGARKTFQALAEEKTPEIGWMNPAKLSPEYEGLLKEIDSVSSGRLAGNPLPSLLRPQVPLCAANLVGKDASDDVGGKILAVEHEHIIDRRKAMKRKSSGTSEAPLPPDPTAVSDAFGLALSGGGIRSATFCLGVVQTLHKRGLFRQVDYLSTVSGGGYLGTFITSYLGHKEASTNSDQPSDPAARIKEVFGPSLKDKSSDFLNASAESSPLRHLRNNSKFLINGGPWQLLQIVGVVLNGVLASFLMLLSPPLALAWLVKGLGWIEPLLPTWLDRFIAWIEPLLPTWIVKGIAWIVQHILGIVLDILYSIMGWLMDGLGNPEIFYKPGGGLLALLLILTTIFVLIRPFAQRLAEGKPWESFPVTARRFVENTGNVLSLSTLLAALVSGSYIWVAKYESITSTTSKLNTPLDISNIPDWGVATISALVPTLLGLLARRRDGSRRGWANLLFFLTGPLFFLVTFTIIASHLGVASHKTPHSAWAFTSLLLLGWMFVALNINTISLHRYYRDRLCGCYLAVAENSESGTPEKGTNDTVCGSIFSASIDAYRYIKRRINGIVHGTGPGGAVSSPLVGTLRFAPLSTAGESPAAPYHLINAVLNVPASRNPGLRGRNGDFFLFSRAYCGSPLTGYIPTTEMEVANPGIDLGTAMAISGAAVSSNMGSVTRRERRFLMTLLNIRLGYWMRRPGRGPKLGDSFRFKARRWVSRLFSGPGPHYFFREMTGALSERARYVNLSDGGHIENLATYELLRRQCKFIICVDAGMEPGMECADLMRLQRLAEIDFGIRMHFDSTELTPLPTKFSRAYGVLVKIDYAPERTKPGRETSDELGWMLYLKLAVTGTEPRHVLDYRRQNPAFPHQTTNDQFYDEAQFESYRSLGQCAASSLFREEIIGKNNAGKELEVKDWFDLLGQSLLADNDEALVEK